MGRVVNRVGVALATVLAVMGYALMHDLFDGLPFTQSTQSWGLWAAGLFVFGLIGIGFEAAFEWFVEPDEPWRRGPSRIVRVAVSLLLLSLVATVIVISK